MGFRNPITSLSADQITPGVFPPGVVLPADQLGPGTLSNQVIAKELADGAVNRADILVAGVVAGDAIAANAIDGKVITGATIRTAASGRRVELRSDYQDRLSWQTGDPAQTSPGEILVQVSGLGTGRQAALVVTAPKLTSDVWRPSITLISRSPAGGAGEKNQVLIDGGDGPVDLVSTDRVKIWGDLEVDGDLTVLGATTYRTLRASLGASKVNSGSTLTSIAVHAVSVPTRLVVRVDGQAGFDTVARKVGVQITRNVPSWPMIEAPRAQVHAPAAGWATVVGTAQIDVPAGTSGIVQAVSWSDGPAYHSGQLSIQRVPGAA